MIVQAAKEGQPLCMKKNERENAPGAEKEKKVGRDDMEKKASRVGEWSRKEGRCRAGRPAWVARMPCRGGDCDTRSQVELSRIRKWLTFVVFVKRGVILVVGWGLEFQLGMWHNKSL